MGNLIFSQIIPDTLLFIWTLVFCMLAYNIKTYIKSHKALIDKQKVQLEKSMEEKQYEAEKIKAIEIINAVEQMGKEFSWKGAAKHSRATEIISQDTNLSTEDIFNIIKATVNEFNNKK